MKTITSIIRNSENGHVKLDSKIKSERGVLLGNH